MRTMILILAALVSAPAVSGQMTLEDLQKLCANKDDQACIFFIYGAVESYGIGHCIKEGVSIASMTLLVKTQAGADVAAYPDNKKMPAVSFVAAVAEKYLSCK